MRILLATIGSDGDLQPFYALAQRLMANGHDVRLASSNRYEKRAAELGIPFVAGGPPWDEAKARALFEKVLVERAPLKQLAIVLDGIVDDQRAGVPQLRELCSDVDLVVYPPLFVAAAAVARAIDKPHVSVQLAPIHPADGYGPTGSNMGVLLNRAMWWLAKRMLRKATDARLNTIVTAAGLQPWRDVLVHESSSQLLDLVAVSPHVLPRDSAWPAHTRVTGYWFVDEPAFSPDPELAAFVEGERPAVVGFGSMMGMDARATTEIILQAARDFPRPVVLQSGWAGLGAASLPKNVKVASFVPHAWLFGRAACAIHHGGAGTTAAAFRAGIPQTVVWHLGDQPVWGREVAKHGVGLPARSHHDLDARWLRETLDRLVSDPAMASRAKDLGAKVRAEDGLGEAVSAIESVMR